VIRSVFLVEYVVALIGLAVRAAGAVPAQRRLRGMLISLVALAAAITPVADDARRLGLRS
jgi:hypothetical protein